MDLDNADPDELSHGGDSSGPTTYQIRMAPASLIFRFDKNAVSAYTSSYDS